MSLRGVISSILVLGAAGCLHSSQLAGHREGFAGEETLRRKAGVELDCAPSALELKPLTHGHADGSFVSVAVVGCGVRQTYLQLGHDAWVGKSSARL